MRIMVGGERVHLTDQSDSIVRIISNGKRWEPETRAAWASLVMQGAGGMVLDVGAYTGVYAIAAALMGAKVMALEPHPENFARLLVNIALNRVEVEARQVAASSAQGARFLYTKGRRLNDTASLERDDVLKDKVEVQAMRIDDMALLARVGLIKIDVEHHEVDVLLGAQYTLKECKPVVVVETLDALAFDTVAQYMRGIGYALRGTLDARNKVFECE